MLKFAGRIPKPPGVGFSLPKALIAAALLAVGAAPSAMAADTASSSNWAGYAVHRAGVRFTKVVGAWTQPNATCVAGQQAYSAIWLGLGGYAQSSNALEQIGSEVDCTAAGRVSSSAWYELVPAVSRTIRMTVKPGDAMSASVSVNGRRVVLSLVDSTRHQTFSKVLQASVVDVSSAEWIIEAPSDCVSANSCQTLPLADFVSANFAQARAQSVSGHVGSISDRAWGATKIQLRPSGRRFVVLNGSGPTVGTATPSALNPRGTTFTVAYSPAPVQATQSFAARTTAVRAGQLVHPTR
jgi:hypothetical protein